MNIIQDAMSASMPGSAKQFLGSVQPKPVGQMIMYVAIIALLPLMGYLIGGLIGWGGITWGAIFGIIMYIGTIVGVIGTGFAVAILSNGLVGRQVSNEEAVTLVGYAATPAIVIGFLTGILSGMWALGIVGSIIGFLAWLYMAYILYLGAGARFGADKAIVVTIVALVAWIIISFIFSAIAGAIVWSMLWASIANQY
jgi:hypothetical protein